MIRQGHIAATEGIVLVAAVLSAKVFLSEPSVAAEWAGTSVVLVVFLNGLLAVVLAWMVLTTLDPAREEGLVEQLERLGGVFGTLLAATIAFTFLGVTSLGLREQGGQMLAAVLPRTPITAVEGATVLVFSYAAFLGLEAIARAAMVFAVPTVLGVLFLLFMSFPRLRFEHLLPLLGYGWRPTLTFSLLSGWYREAWLAALLMVYLRKRTQGLEVGIRGIAVGTAIITLVTAGLLAKFGFPNLTRLPFPAFEGARAIYAGEFVSNLESIFVFLFTAAIFLKLSILFWGTCILVADLLHLAEYRPLIPLLGTLTWLVAFLPASLMEAIHWVDHDLRRTTSLIIYPGILLFWVLGILRRRKERRHDK